ncbi:putative transcriptional regulator [Methanolinea mesophila]|uniref:winged helix-turn-helix domain-containing protein n=1 Tax=Methanolinea mesophila TaxID=547055 RepID=UPI001FD7FA53|nr:winged helix-turn-helix domain-containing protein [Methanolinea mesophila]MBP1927743.1 putative transcriptional regulator [Methanolinea mesophila]
MNVAERRTSYEICWEILTFCSVPRTFTAIVGRCDLNSKNGQKYLGLLAGRGFLNVEDDGERSHYVATDRAEEFITQFTLLYKGLYDKGPGFRL